MNLFLCSCQLTTSFVLVINFKLTAKVVVFFSKCMTWPRGYKFLKGYPLEAKTAPKN